MATKREEVETEVDRGVIAFLETFTIWIVAAGIVFTVLAFVNNLDI